MKIYRRYLAREVSASILLVLAGFLALFGFLIPVPWIGGVGASTAIVALALYALLPILRNTCTGILEPVIFL